jgi:hypothetical protein
MYVNDVAGSALFYEKISGFALSAISENAAAMRAGNRRVSSLFNKGGSRLIQSAPDGNGEPYVAFAIPASELATEKTWLTENGIAVEKKRTWELGGQGIYFGILTATW